MKKLFFLSLFLFPATLFAKATVYQFPTKTPVVVPTQSGNLISGNCVKADANGNMVDNGAVCGGGGGGSWGSITGTLSDQTDLQNALNAKASLTTPTFITNITTPIMISGAADPADAGVIRLGNGELIETEANPAGTDLTFGMDANNVFTASTPINATTGFRIGNAAASGKFLSGNGTNFVASTSTIPTSAGASAGKYLKSDATNYILSTGSASGVGTCTNQFVSATNDDAAPTCSTVTLSGAQFANQGTTTTVLHGNGAGNPSFATVGTNDIAANAATLAKLDASTATANKVLMSGSSASPTWSTPTFPNASATTRKIIISDGTNWTPSTETYAAPGTSTHLMQSDGTNWTSVAIPTWNQNTTGSAASLSISGQTALLTFAGLASTSRIITIRDAADTMLELGGSYTPTGTWTNMTLVTPALGTPASGVATNLTGLPAASVLAGTLGSGAFTTDSIIYANNAVTASANAATVPITKRLTTVTNNSAATLTITITTASATDGQLLIVRVFDFSAAAQTVTWVNTENSTVSAPTTSNGSTTLPLTVGFMYNSATSKWRTIASA